MNIQQARLFVGIGVIFFAIALVLIGDAGVARWVIAVAHLGNRRWYAAQELKIKRTSPTLNRATVLRIHPFAKRKGARASEATRVGGCPGAPKTQSQSWCLT